MTTLRPTVSTLLIPVCGALIFIMPYATPNLALIKMLPGIAVLMGIILAIVVGNPYQLQTRILATKLLTWSIVGLGFGMNLITVAKVGLHGIGYTLTSILIALILGLFLGKLLRTGWVSSLLVTVGTAICGGSAIAAVAPTIHAKPHDISIALAIVFALNAGALFLFPVIGHYLHLSQEQFGLWSALAIHDTSSVVGASMQYGQQALTIGTTIKLARALWIVPLTLAISFWYSRQRIQQNAAVKKPWFIVGFLLTAAMVTYIPGIQPISNIIKRLAEQGLVVALYCIGLNISIAMIKEVGVKAFLQGLLLWLIMASVSLGAVYFNIIGL